MEPWHGLCRSLRSKHRTWEEPILGRFQGEAQKDWHFPILLRLCAIEHAVPIHKKLWNQILKTIYDSPQWVDTKVCALIPCNVLWDGRFNCTYKEIKKERLLQMRSASQPKGVKTQVLTLVILDNLLVSCTYLAIWRGHLPSNGASLVFRIWL